MCKASHSINLSVNSIGKKQRSCDDETAMFTLSDSWVIAASQTERIHLGGQHSVLDSVNFKVRDGMNLSKAGHRWRNVLSCIT